MASCAPGRPGIRGVVANRSTGSGHGPGGAPPRPGCAPSAGRFGLGVLSSREASRLWANLSSLAAVQAATYLVPIVTLPYLVRVLGPDKVGLLAFSQAFIQYFALFVDYGFSVSATRKIALQRQDPAARNELVSTVLSIQLALYALSFMAIVVICTLVSRFREESTLYLLTFLPIVGSVLTPLWFFQGVEETWGIARVNLVAKTLLVVSIFLLIREKSDYLLVPALNAAIQLGVGAWAVSMLVRAYGVRLRRLRLDRVRAELRSGWAVFVSMVSSSLYTISNTFLLGLFTNNATVGYYSAAERLVRASYWLKDPAVQALYPMVTRVAGESRVAGMVLVRRIALWSGGAGLGVALLLFVFAPEFVMLVLGSQYEPSIGIVRILAWLPLVIGVGTTYANLFLLAFGYTKVWARIIVASSVVSVTGAVVLIYGVRLGHIGMAINWLGTEFLILALSFGAYMWLRREKEDRGEAKCPSVRSVTVG